MAARVTAPSLLQSKQNQEKIVCLTAYDAPSAVMADEAGVDVILIGDTLGNVIQGRRTTIPVTLEDVVYHTKCVAPFAKRALVISDLPFGTYQTSVHQAVESSIALLKAGAHAVKLEGPYYEAISAIAKAGIPVMGHAGMTPQSFHAFGGFKVQGEGDQGDQVQDMCIAIQESGAFSVVLELIPRDLAERISQALVIPTIGIGAGAGCDGQIQVWHDLLGLGKTDFRHAKVYVKGRSLFLEGIKSYVSEVKGGTFPTEEHSF